MKRPHAFTLTENERKVLELCRAGLKYREMYAELGWHYTGSNSSIGTLILSARHKEKCAILWDKQQRHSGISTPLQAKGRAGRIADQEAEIWRTGEKTGKFAK